MRINVLVVEDDPITAEDISEVLQECGMHVMDKVPSGESALEVVRNKKPDVILMDVNLEGELDGVVTASMLNETDNIPLIYLTANSDKVTALRAINTHPSAFITKPFDESNVIFAIELAFSNHLKKIFESEQQNIKSQEAIFLKRGDIFEKVMLSDILYIKADGSYSHVFTKNGKYASSNNLNAACKNLTMPSFMRIHRSYVINTDNVTGFDVDFVYFDEQYVPYSKNNKEELLRRFKRMT
ncbi:MAG: response regulator [Reichenbachiella sp.]|uniref:LytR/AlgR family response regulator transcription factor n=1 Tax=Reichenbachiella sp. TaxID=2184521 RepID=UPI0029674055|nr:response regulator [Reichenbachiella sp.]MDW3209988.1 response regulator [Reichenbachiella sp.]